MIAAARRDPMARSQVSFPPGGRTISTCGAPSSGSPVSGSVSRVSTLTGVSSAPSTGSSARAACIASSNAAAWSFSSSRALARSTKPGETGTPSSIAIRRAARSDGTFPYPLSSTAAALIPAPYEMVPGYAPGGASAVVSFPQHRHSSDGSSHRSPTGRSSRPRSAPTTSRLHSPRPGSPRTPSTPPAHPRSSARPDHGPGTGPRRGARAAAALAVLALLPLRGIPVPALGLAALFGPDRLLRARRPRVAAVHAQPTFQFGDPQLKPTFPVQRRRQLRPQHRVLAVLRLHHSPQPGQQFTLLPGTAWACTVSAKPSCCIRASSGDPAAAT